MPKDPICGMSVDEKSAIKVASGAREYFFCSRRCKDKFIVQEGISKAEVCIPVKGRFYKNKLFIIASVTLMVTLASFFVPALVSFRSVFFMYIRSVWWAVLLGLFLGGLIDYYIPREYISKILSKRRPATIFIAVFLGFLMSACSHGILALSMQIHKKGASNPAVVSFLLASPWANFTVTVMLISLFGLKEGLFVIFAAIIVAINTGFIFMLLEKKNLIEKNKNTAEVLPGYSILQDMRIRMGQYRLTVGGIKKDFYGVMNGVFSLADMVLWWVLVGMLIASVAGAYIPVGIFRQFMGPSLLGLFVTLILATVIEVCSEGSSPFAFEIYRQTGALGNSFTFLMAGVATDYTEIGLLWTNVGRRTAIWLLVVAVPQIVAIGYLANIIFR